MSKVMGTQKKFFLLKKVLTKEETFLILFVARYREKNRKVIEQLIDEITRYSNDNVNC